MYAFPEIWAHKNAYESDDSYMGSMIETAYCMMKTAPTSLPKGLPPETILKKASPMSLHLTLDASPQKANHFDWW